MLRTRLRAALKRSSWRIFFTLDRIGIHVMPKHYYTPVADYAMLRRNSLFWRRRVSLEGVDWDLDRQLAWLESMCRPFVAEVAGLTQYDRLASTGLGPGFGPIESQVLHCVVRALKPSRIVEIGSGVSTLTMAEAVQANGHASADRETSIVVVDPFPRQRLLAEVRPYPVQVDRAYAQIVPADIFASLGKGDLLFIDSSHAVKTASEVPRLYLDIVPSLAPGVVIHIHDVSLPYTYQPSFGRDYFDWQETSLLLALLKHNSRLRVLCALSALHHDRPRELRTVLPDYRPQATVNGLRNGAPGNEKRHFPSSLWLETC